MVERTPEIFVDHRDEHFVVSCPFDGALHAELRALPQGRYDPDEGTWQIPHHLRSVAGLMRIVRSHDGTLSVSAVRAQEALYEELKRAEFRLQLVHGTGGDHWFKCHADDNDLEARIRAIPGATCDDEPRTWLIPAYVIEACEALRTIVDESGKFAVDPAAERHLDEPQMWAPLCRPDEPSEADESAQPTPDAETKRPLDRTVETFELEQELLDLSAAEEADPELPELKGILRPYQRAGVHYLLRAQRALLADEVGLGKSVQVLAALEAAKAYPALVLCSAADSLQWQRRVERWLPDGRSVHVLDEVGPVISAADIVVVSYDALHRVVTSLKARVFKALVADDCQLMSSERLQRTRAALALAANGPQLRFGIFRGRFMEHPVELISQLKFIDRLGEFGGEFDFEDRYCRPRRDAVVTRYGAARLDELEKRLRATCVCRRERAWVVRQLPVTMRDVHVLRLAGSEAHVSLVEQARAKLRVGGAPGGDGERPALLAQLLHDCGQRKLPSLVAWIKAFLARGQWLVVFVSEPGLLHELSENFPEALCVNEAGECSRRGRGVNHFFASNTELMICALGAAGPALTLARGRHVAFAEIGWEASAHLGAEAIADGAFGRQAGSIHYLLGDNSVDESVFSVLAPRLRGELPDLGLEPLVHELLRGSTARVRAAGVAAHGAPTG